MDFDNRFGHEPNALMGTRLDFDGFLEPDAGCPPPERLTGNPSPAPGTCTRSARTWSGNIPSSLTPQGSAASARQDTSAPPPSRRTQAAEMNSLRQETAPVTSATAETLLQITCPRRSPGPAVFTAKTPRNGLEIGRDCARLSGNLRGVGRSAVPVVDQSDGQPSRIFIHRRTWGERPQLPLSGLELVKLALLV